MPVKLHLRRDAHRGPDCRKAPLQVREVATRPDYNPRVIERAQRRKENLVGTYHSNLNRKRRRTRIVSQHGRARRKRRPAYRKATVVEPQSPQERAYQKVYSKPRGRMRRFIDWLKSLLRRVKAIKP